MKKLFLGAFAFLIVLAAPALALASNCSPYPFTLTNGTTADANQVMSDLNIIMSCANTNLAHNGANTDITSINSLTTPLTTGQGGTGNTNIYGTPDTWTAIQTFQAANLFTGANVFSTATQTIAGGTSALAAAITNIAEPVTVSATAATGTINYDVTTQSVLYYTTNSSANFTLNLRGNSTTTLGSLMAVGQSVTVAFLPTEGTTGFFASAVQVDGTTAGVTTKWQGGAPAAGGTSGIDAYTFCVIKTGAGTYTVLASQSKFF